MGTQLGRVLRAGLPLPTRGDGVFSTPPPPPLHAYTPLKLDVAHQVEATALILEPLGEILGLREGWFIQGEWLSSMHGVRS
jgi:hypothetical protein